MKEEKTTIPIPETITAMLRRNAEVAQQLQHESNLILTGFLAGKTVDTTKKYQPNQDFTELIEVQ